MEGDIGEAESDGTMEGCGFGILFEWEFFEFHETFGTGKGIDEVGKQTSHVEHGSLYAVDELCEGDEYADGDDSGLELEESPDESDEVG